MIIFKTAAEINNYIKTAKNQQHSIGFVPTMGALHNGHISLIKRSKQENWVTVCSIFVNPTQFNNPDDFKKYPITIENDIDMLEGWGCDILFLPGVKEIYPPSYTAPHYELGYLETVLEGKYRPGHFQGVCQVVDRLLTISIPDKLYLGQKDFQQCMVITRLVEISKIDTKIIICTTLREEDGLAMSSRNARLHKDERMLAVKIYETMMLVKNEITRGPLAELKAKATAFLSSYGFRPDYIEIAGAGKLDLKDEWDGKEQLVVLVAAYLGDVRLIDNMLLN